MYAAFWIQVPMYYLEWLKYFALILASGHIQMAESYKKDYVTHLDFVWMGFLEQL